MPQLRSSLVAFAAWMSVMTALLGACSSSSSDDTTASGGDGGHGSSGGGGSPDATVITSPGSDGGPGGGGTAADASDGSSGDAAPVGCTQNTDCSSHVCAAGGICAAPTCSDGARNGNETDIDCGGSCTPCDSLKTCAVAADCQSGVCTDRMTGLGLECQAPTSTDGVKNGTETGIDCGGMGNPTCAAGQGCVARTDCTSEVCVLAEAGTGMVCATPACNDGQQNGTETDVDCGGPACPGCADTKACLVGTDCKDEVCKATAAGDPLSCQAPTYTDGVKNGTETDVDCGGSGDPTKNACAATKSCLTATDCQSDGCDYTKHCAIRRSCVGTSTSGGHYGADTCGAGGAGSSGTQAWESCCETVPITVTEGTPTATTTMQMDKYRVTAGRFRAFLENVSYDVKDFVASARAAGQIPAVPLYNSTNLAGQTVLDPAWDAYLPTSLTGTTAEPKDCLQGDWDTTNLVCKTAGTSPVYTSAQMQVGPTIYKDNTQPEEQGCSYSSPGIHMYYLGATDYSGDKALYSQSTYDEKPMQCVDYLMAQAFCIWDGGRLETTAEWVAAWGPGTMPWSADTTDKDSRGIPFANLLPQNSESGTYTGCRWPTVNDATIQGTSCPFIPSATSSIEIANYEYNYEYPNLLNPANDFSPFVAAPGRALGRAPNGAADIVGGLLEMTSDIKGTKNSLSPFDSKSASSPRVEWAGNGSWEVHDYQIKEDYPGSYGLTDKYGKQGIRCVHPN